VLNLNNRSVQALDTQGVMIATSQGATTALSEGTEMATTGIPGTGAPPAEPTRRCHHRPMVRRASTAVEVSSWRRAAGAGPAGAGLAVSVLGHTMSLVEEVAPVGVLGVAFISAAVWRFEPSGLTGSANGRAPDRDRWPAGRLPSWATARVGGRSSYCCPGVHWPCGRQK